MNCLKCASELTDFCDALRDQVDIENLSPSVDRDILLKEALSRTALALDALHFKVLSERRRCQVCGRQWGGVTSFDGKLTVPVCRESPNSDGTWNYHAYVEEDAK